MLSEQSPNPFTPIRHEGWGSSRFGSETASVRDHCNVDSPPQPRNSRKELWTKPRCSRGLSGLWSGRYGRGYCGSPVPDKLPLRSVVFPLLLSLLSSQTQYLRTRAHVECPLTVSTESIPVPLDCMLLFVIPKPVRVASITLIIIVIFDPVGLRARLRLPVPVRAHIAGIRAVVIVAKGERVNVQPTERGALVHGVLVRCGRIGVFRVGTGCNEYESRAH